MVTLLLWIQQLYPDLMECGEAVWQHYYDRV